MLQKTQRPGIVWGRLLHALMRRRQTQLTVHSLAGAGELGRRPRKELALLLNPSQLLGEGFNARV
eukprot:6029054-Pyramimonas_sp.AAC.1